MSGSSRAVAENNGLTWFIRFPVPAYPNPQRQAILIGRTRKAFNEWPADKGAPPPIQAHATRLLKPYKGSEEAAVKALQKEEYLSPRKHQDGEEALKWTKFPRQAGRQLPPFHLDTLTEATKRKKAGARKKTKQAQTGRVSQRAFVAAGSSSLQASGRAQVTSSSSSQTQPSFYGCPSASAPLSSPTFAAAAAYRLQGPQHPSTGLYGSLANHTPFRSPSPTFAAASFRPRSPQPAPVINAYSASPNGNSMAPRLSPSFIADSFQPPSWHGVPLDSIDPSLGLTTAAINAAFAPPPPSPHLPLSTPAAALPPQEALQLDPAMESSPSPSHSRA